MRSDASGLPIPPRSKGTPPEKWLSPQGEPTPCSDTVGALARAARESCAWGGNALLGCPPPTRPKDAEAVGRLANATTPARCLSRPATFGRRFHVGGVHPAFIPDGRRVAVFFCKVYLEPVRRQKLRLSSLSRALSLKPIQRYSQYLPGSIHRYSFLRLFQIGQME